MKTRLATAIAALSLLATTVAPALAESRARPSALDARFGIAEGFRNPGVMADIGPGWERLILPWDQVQPNGAGDFSKLGQTLSSSQLQGELDRGVRVAGLLQFTPGWAQADPSAGKRSAPKNLDLPFDDPNNYFGQYVERTVSYYRGRINEWIIWNEPEFRPSDPGAGGSYTWLGTDEQFAQLMKVGYLAAKKANPAAVVSFPGTSYWVEQNQGRTQFYERILNILNQDPNAAANNYYHDVVSLNLYRAPDDIYRVYGVFKGIQQKYGIDKPLWLTETNAMPSDDSAIPCADKQANKPIKTTMEQQAAYAVQAFAMAAAAGYQRIEHYQMVDANTCAEPEVWGVTRDDGSRRPVADALKTTMTYLSGFTSARFLPLAREAQNWSPWPDDPTSLVPNWQVYQVAVDRPGNQRVTVLWSGDGSPLRVRVRKNGTSAKVVDRRGVETPLQENQGWWVVTLPGATAHFATDPDGYYFIGGDPLLIVEEGVDPTVPPIAPRLGEPGSVPRDFVVQVTGGPVGDTVAYGDPADYAIRTIGHEDFSDPISLRIAQWSTQRFPDPQDGSTFPMGVDFPGTINPGDRAAIHFDTSTAPEPGIYYVTFEASGGGITRSFDLALVLN